LAKEKELLKIDQGAQLKNSFLCLAPELQKGEQARRSISQSNKKGRRRYSSPTSVRREKGN